MGFIFDTQFLREVFERALHVFYAHYLRARGVFRSCQLTFWQSILFMDGDCVHFCVDR